ncbi:MAG: PDZ domain-containing protein [Pirellulales bacterium]|nr:PDZ domain-containing protein [Pirellulales bacterium]
MTRTAKKLSQCLLCIALCGISLAAYGATLGDAHQVVNLPTDQVDQWITELDDDRFHVRESAMRRLSELDASVVPRLADAAADGSMEVVIRAIAAMRSIAGHDDEASQVVRAQLQRLAEPSYTLAGRHAGRALQEIVIIESVRAREELLSLGARYGTLSNTGIGLATPHHFEFTRDWRGDADDFSKIRRVRDLQIVTLIGSKFTDDVVEPLLSIAGATEIQLYSTKLSDAAIDELRERFDGKLDIRVGAKLGVTSDPLLAFPCRIESVVPGSAAHKAGILPGDLVIACEGEQVKNFDKLTSIISEKAPGDTLTLEISRGRRKLTVSATLGGW